jgi:hypothetical protein
MGDVSRINRVEPATPLGDHLRVAQSGDRPGGQQARQEPKEEPEDQVELHSETEEAVLIPEPEPELDEQVELPAANRLSIDIAV